MVRATGFGSLADVFGEGAHANRGRLIRVVALAAGEAEIERRHSDGALGSEDGLKGVQIDFHTARRFS